MERMIRKPVRTIMTHSHPSTDLQFKFTPLVAK